MLSKFSVKKPYTVMVGVILVLILGVVSFSNMTADLFPDINMPYAMVMTTYPGASPEEVELIVSKPVEQAMATVSNIENIQSVSSENLSMVILQFSQTTDMDSVSLEMRENLDQIRSYWDDSVGNPVIMKLNPEMMPVMIAAVEKDDLDSVGVTNLVEEELLSEMESLEGVASVNTSGEVEESVQVLLRQDKIDKVNKKISSALGTTFDEAKEKLEDTEEELNKAQSELESGKSKLQSGQQELTDRLSQAAGAQAQILEGESQLNVGEQQLESAQAELNSKRNELNGQINQLKSGVPVKDETYQAAYDQAYEAALGEAYAQADAKVEQQIASQIALVQKKIEELEGAAQQQKQGTDLQEGIEESAGAEGTVNTAVLSLEEIPGIDLPDIDLGQANALEALNMYLEVLQSQETMDTAKKSAESAAKLVLDQSFPESFNKEYCNKALEVLQEVVKKLDEAQAQLDEKKEELSVIRQQLESGKISLAQAQSQIESAKITATIEMAAAQSQLAMGKTKIEEGKSQLEEGKKQLEDSQKEALEKAKLDGKVTPEMITQILTAQNFSMPAGYVTEEGIQYLVRVGDKFEDTENIEDLILFDMGLEDLEPIRLKDVADVAVTNNASEVYAKINGKPGVVLTMQKQTGYSTGEVSDRLKDKFESLMDSHEGLHITPLMDQGIYIDLVVDSVLNNLISGGILAILILFVFLKDIRPTAIVACSIPISVLGAVVLMYFSGITLNIISLSGLALGVGMLVDNSIVVIENIYRLRSLGVSVRKAAVQGARQVAAAIISSTLTTICVFLPIVFTKGITRQLFVDMGLTIGYSLLASLVVALSLVPAMSSGMLKKTTEKSHPWLDKMNTVYGRMMEKILHRKALVLVLMVVLLLGSGILALRKGTSFIPSMESTQASVSITMPEGSSVEETGAMADEVMTRLEDLEDIQDMGAMAGGGSGMSLGGSSDSTTASIYLLLSEDKKLSGQELSDEIVKRTKDLDCELLVNTNNMDMSALGGSGIQIQVKGKELDTIQKFAGDVAAILENVEGLEQISDGMEEATSELRLVVKKDVAAKYNLTTAQVFQQIQKQLSQQGTATTLSTESKDYDIVVQDEKQQSFTREDVKDFTIQYTDQEGNSKKVPLMKLAEFVDTQSPDSIQRDNQSRYLMVSAVVSDGYNVGILGKEVNEQLKKYQVPDGYSVEMTGEDETIQEAMTEVLKMLGLAVIFIYLIMVAQFQSLLSPFIVMFTMPLAFTGGFLGLAFTGQEVSVIAMIGFVMLSGIIVNNGIVLVDYTNQLREEGMEKHQAIIQAGKTRMRPILMTALTTILGLSTMALGMGMGADMMQPMAVVVIGGLLYGTILTLFVVPCIYDILNRKKYHKDRDNELDDTDYIPETVEAEK